MLVLTRKAGEKIVIDESIVIEVLEILIPALRKYLFKHEVLDGAECDMRPRLSIQSIFDVRTHLAVEHAPLCKSECLVELLAEDGDVRSVFEQRISVWVGFAPQQSIHRIEVAVKEPILFPRGCLWRSESALELVVNLPASRRNRIL